ncbi:larval cuticle protein LCP-17-like [Spodoptera frugiperda]|uniref:Larval cuticle protein LCP-17-like n=1 Tax=Spodoptera frugiperda TaxID=7108 RepID=A0A2H1W455_SPOFR|nr:larval cuticle protein LCP-17-like [Spodoptera frugiperda]
MKFLVVLAVAVACASADVSHVVKDDFHAPIESSSFDIEPQGDFKYSFKTGNGIYAEESGVLKNANSDYPSLDVSGGFKYTSPEGQAIELSYVADENGYRPQGSHLPVGPEIPAAIIRSLEYIAAHPPPAEVVRASPAKLG